MGLTYELCNLLLKFCNTSKCKCTDLCIVKIYSHTRIIKTQKMENSNNTAGLIGGLLLGTVIGGAIGILFAPDKGVDTRKKIMSKGDDLTDAMKDRFNDFLDEIKREYAGAKGKAHELVEDVTSKVDHMGSKMERAAKGN